MDAQLSAQRDIDRIIERLIAEIPKVSIAQLQVRHPGNDDDGLWFVNVAGQKEQAQLESSSGNCPFLVESDFNNERFMAESVEEAVAIVKWLYTFD